MGSKHDYPLGITLSKAVPPQLFGSGPVVARPGFSLDLGPVVLVQGMTALKVKLTATTWAKSSSTLV